ncbi:MAG: DUF2244 domain-containing protein [Immundisolibacterales bacterium]|nr:DUF2244 domain-containing protein [Immundisolibacterales bacterium]
MSGEGPDHTVVLRPNLSLSWRQAKALLVVVALVLAGLASGFAVVGLWTVLPLAGAEWLALAVALYVVQRRGHRMEIVSVRGGCVAVEKGCGPLRASKREFPRGWVRVHLRRSPVRGYPSRLVLAMHGEEVALGDFLAEDERRHAAKLLHRTLVRPFPDVAATAGSVRRG